MLLVQSTDFPRPSCPITEQNLSSNPNMFAFIFFLILIFPSENMSDNQELEIKRLKSDVAKLIQEIDKLNKRISVLPPSVIHHDINRVALMISSLMEKVIL